MPHDSFFAAPFAVDGELLGIGSWRASDLSPRWLRVCERLLAEGGHAFRSALGPELPHLEVQFTSANGAGIGTFFAGGAIGISAAYLRGQDAGTEREVLEMFVRSLRATPLVQQAKATDLPFEGVFQLRERPLHVVVPWGNPTMSEQDEEIIGELSNHFAAAYLCRTDD
jgi:hypothetical protein